MKRKTSASKGLAKQKRTKKSTTLKRTTKKQSTSFKEDVKKLVDKAKTVMQKKTSKNDKDVAASEHKASSKKSKPAEAQVSFFYTSNKFFSQMDDQFVIESIQQKYPRFLTENMEEKEMKSLIVQIFQDKPFVMHILESFDLTFQEFFKFIFRTDLAIFKGPYLHKLQRILKECKYDISR